VGYSNLKSIAVLADIIALGGYSEMPAKKAEQPLFETMTRGYLGVSLVRREKLIFVFRSIEL
jgi:hypothetical protein